MRHFFNIILIYILSCHLLTIHAQCSIDSMNIEMLPCQIDQSFGVEVQLYSQNPSIGYRITANGADYGIYTIDQFPVSLSDIAGNCVTDYNFVVTDIADSACSANEVIGQVCCNEACDLAAEVSHLECVNNEIYFDLILSGDGPNADSVTYYLDGNEVGSDNVENNTVSGILASEDIVEILTVCYTNSECCDTIDINNPCICNIYNIKSTVVDCSDESNDYYLIIDFDVSAPASDSFRLGRPTNGFGIHAYSDLPIQVGPIEHDEPDDDIFIVDAADAFCFGYIEHITLDSCEAINCNLSNLNIQADTLCNANGEYEFHFSFETNIIENEYALILDGVLVDTFSYSADGYNYLTTANCNSEMSLTIQSISSPDCSITGLLPALCCQCNLTDLLVEQYCNNDLIDSLRIDFNHIGVLSDSFALSINGQVDHYAYDMLPLIVNNVSTGDFEINISDIEYQHCVLQESIEKESCINCEIYDLEIMPLECDASNQVANFNIRFKVKGTDQDSVSIYYNDSLIEKIEIDTAIINEYTITGLAIDCENDLHTFTVASNSDNNCIATVTQENLMCCNNCLVSNVTFESYCEDYLGNIVINIEHMGTDTDSVLLFSGLLPYKNVAFTDFPYVLDALEDGELQLGITALNCDTTWTSIDLACEMKDCFSDITIIDTTCTGASSNFNISIAESLDQKIHFTLNGESQGNFGPGAINLSGSSDAEEISIVLQGIQDTTCVSEFIIENTCDAVNTNEELLKNIEIFNKHDQLLVYSENTLKSICIFDLLGNCIIRNNSASNMYSFNISNYPKGIYIIQITMPDGSLGVQKVFF